jgi:peptidyl-tRNA hydrolase, PTH1 family
VRSLRKKALNKNDRLLIIGLGNPGPKYEGTRHNAGFLVIDNLAERIGTELKKQHFAPFAWGRKKISNREIYLVKPYTFMNRSGEALGQIFRKTGCTINDTVVICDSLDLDPGIIRIKRKGGSGGQKGLESVISATGGSNFSRVYVGIGRPKYRGEVPAYVLSRPAGTEAELFLSAIERAGKALSELVSNELNSIMNEYNRST